VDIDDWRMDRRDFLKFCGAALATLGLHKVPFRETAPENELSGPQNDVLVWHDEDCAGWKHCIEPRSFLSGDYLEPGNMVYVSQYGSASKNPIGHPGVGFATNTAQPGEVVNVAVSGWYGIAVGR
jgi:hypothetical protein